MLSAPVVVLDFETTGLDWKHDRITEVAVLRLEGNRVTDRYVTLVNPETEIPEAAENLNGISDAMVASAPKAMEIMPRLRRFIGNSIVVAHNAKFDQRFLEAESRRASIPQTSCQTICTILLARRLQPDLDRYTLSCVAESLGVEYPGQAHRAEADAIVTAGVLFKLVQLLTMENSVEAVDPKLLSLATTWPIRETPARLKRELARTLNTRRDNNVSTARTVKEPVRKSPVPVHPERAKTNQSQMSRRWLLLASGNLLDRDTNTIVVVRDSSYEGSNNRVLVAKGLDGTTLRIRESELDVFEERTSTGIYTKPLGYAKFDSERHWREVEETILTSERLKGR